MLHRVKSLLQRARTCVQRLRYWFFFIVANGLEAFATLT
jgi:hypothetical protein